MEQYWVEGLFLTKKGLKKTQKTGKINQVDIEPFCMSFWANNPEEAVQAATEKLAGGQWTQGPRVTKTSEEQRMRMIGAPELPGIALPTHKMKKKR